MIQTTVHASQYEYAGEGEQSYLEGFLSCPVTAANDTVGS